MSVPLLGQGQSSLPAPEPIDLYDEDILVITGIVNDLAFKHQKSHRNYQSVESEIHDRFNSAGFLVYVNWYHFMMDAQTQEGCLPEITVIGRTEKHEFDHDRQVYEVVNNVLDLPGQEKGEWIKTDHDTVKNFMEGNSGHGHDHHH